MHIPDGFLDLKTSVASAALAVGGVGWAIREANRRLPAARRPVMGLAAAFIFAAQMINFSIPGTGSSGHLGGGMILAILLGPYAAFLVIASVLTVQSFFFADGGLLALGCNIFNLGFFPSFIAYPLIYKPIAGGARAGWRFWTGSMLAAVLGLQLGAFGVVIETTMSGVSDLPFKTFVLMMQPIHLAIGIVEGLVTAAVVAFVYKARPVALLEPAAASAGSGNLRRVLIGLLLAVALIGGVLSWFASDNPDGLEWAMGKVSGKEELESPSAGIHKSLSRIQETTAFLPDYGFKSAETVVAVTEQVGIEHGKWPAVNPGTSVSGMVGGLITMVLAGLIGYGLKRRLAF